MESCSICLEPPRFFHTLSCGHGACAVCLGRWVAVHQTCPHCRAPAVLAIRVFGAAADAGPATDEETAAILSLAEIRPRPRAVAAAARPVAGPSPAAVVLGRLRAGEDMAAEFVRLALIERIPVLEIARTIPAERWSLRVIQLLGSRNDFVYCMIPPAARSEEKAIFHLRHATTKNLGQIVRTERTDAVCRVALTVGALHHLRTLPVAFQTAEWFLSLTGVSTLHSLVDELTQMAGPGFWARVGAVAPRMLTQGACIDLMWKGISGSPATRGLEILLFRSGMVCPMMIATKFRTPERIAAALAFSSDAIYAVAPKDRTDAVVAAALETGWGRRSWKQLPEVRFYLKTHVDPSPDSHRPGGPGAHWRERQAAYTAETGNLVTDPTAA